jgi:hypothetical protein
MLWLIRDGAQHLYSTKASMEKKVHIKSTYKFRVRNFAVDQCKSEKASRENVSRLTKEKYHPLETQLPVESFKFKMNLGNHLQTRKH